MQPVGELDQQHAHVVGDRQQELAQVFRLLGFLGDEVELLQLGQALDQRADIVAEQLVDLGAGRLGVLDGVVQQRGGDGRVVELEIGQDRRDFERMREIGIARGALLLAMRLHGVDIGAVEQGLVGVRIVAPDPLDQVVLPHHLRLRRLFDFTVFSIACETILRLARERRPEAAPDSACAADRSRTGHAISLRRPRHAADVRTARYHGNCLCATRRCLYGLPNWPQKDNGPGIEPGRCTRIVSGRGLFLVFRLLLGRRQAFEALEQLFFGHAVGGDLGIVGIDRAAGGADQRHPSGSGSSTSTYFCSE